MATPPRSLLPPDDSETFTTVSLPGRRMAATEPVPAPTSVARTVRLASTPARGAWVKPGDTVHVNGFTLTGGMIYVGTALRSQCLEVEPALINPELPCSSRRADEGSAFVVSFKQSYHEATQADRRAYLQWLSEGRVNPTASRGLVQLFINGLERRLVYDVLKQPEAQLDQPAIVEELKRLLSLYGEFGEVGFRCRSLLEFLAAQEVPPHSYRLPPPTGEWQNAYALPDIYKVILGQMAHDKKRLTPEWAAAWAYEGADFYKSMNLQRHSELFKRVFQHLYALYHPQGLRLQPGDLPMRLHYSPGSPGLKRARSRPLEGVVEVVNDAAISRELKPLAERAVAILEPYLSYLGRKTERANDFAAQLLLPHFLRPEAVQQRLESWQAQVVKAPLVLSLSALFDNGSASPEIHRDSVVALATALENSDIGMAPDVRGGARKPRASDLVVLFSQPCGLKRSLTPLEEAAMTMVEVACSCVLDEQATDQERRLLFQEVAAFASPSEAARMRIEAQARICLLQPLTPAVMKRRMGTLPSEARRPLGQLLAKLSRMRQGGPASTAVARTLRDLYAALGLSAEASYSDVFTEQNPAAGPSDRPAGTVRASEPRPVEVVLDPERIAVLQQETREVSALLGTIFVEEAPAALAPVAVSGPFGLDADHAELLRQLLGQDHWARAELEALAARHDLMLDGALEHLNDVLLDNLGEPLTEGDDPIDINTALREQLNHEFHIAKAP